MGRELSAALPRVMRSIIAGGRSASREAARRGPAVRQNMVTLILIVCLAATPDVCREERPPVDAAAGISCAAQGQLIAAQWLDEGIRNGSCAAGAAASARRSAPPETRAGRSPGSP